MKDITNIVLSVGLIGATLVGQVSAAAKEVREEFHQTYALANTGTIAVGNVNGNVHVTVWDRSEVKVDAIKRARTQQQLDQLTINVQAAPERIRVETKQRNRAFKRSGNTATVDYTLTVPRQARLDTVSTVNGTVEIEGVQGPVKVHTVNGPVTAKALVSETDLSTVNGAVDAHFGDLRHVKRVSLKSVNGGVTVALPGAANADLSADTVNGGIRNDFDLKVNKHFPVGQDLNAKLGEGGPSVKVSTVNGGIIFRRSGAVSPEKAESAE